MHTVHGTIVCDLIPTFLLIDYPSIMEVLENLGIFPTTFALGQKLLIDDSFRDNQLSWSAQNVILWEVYNLV